METSADTSGQVPAHRGKRKKAMLVSLLTAFLIAGAAYLICGISHREGTYTGILTGIEKTGILFKTMEGELKITGILHGQDTIMRGRDFLFSIEDPQVYERLENLQGEKITVRFRQVIYNFFWQGETNYFVEEIKEPVLSGE